MKTLLAALLGFALLLSMATAHSATYYFHNDHLGTPQVVTDSTQAVVWQGDYDPFGKATETVAKVEQNLRFPGQYLDRESGLHYNYFRTYDPSIGRYTQSDPIGLGGGVSTYGYAYQNSLRYTDPTGEIVPAVWWAATALWAVFETAGSAYDLYGTVGVFADECSSTTERVVAGGLFVGGLFLPGAGYSSANKVASGFGDIVANKVDDVIRLPETDKFGNVISRNPRSLQDELTFDAAKRGEGFVKIENLSDAEYKGWDEMELNTTSINDAKTRVHYNRNSQTGETSDFKFITHSTDTPYKP